jgi:hypothetical protein
MRNDGPLGSKSRILRLLHVGFWTALFYGLAVGIAKLLEWMKP